jgi:hypothetical protein
MTRARLLALIVISALKLAFLLSPADAGQVASVANAKRYTSIRHTRRMTRITVLRPVRAQGRAAAGYPFLQTTANVTRIGVNLSGLINPIGWFF